MIPGSGTITWELGGSFPWPYQVLFEESADGLLWNKLGWGAPKSGTGYRLTGLKLPTKRYRYVRATGFFMDGKARSVSLWRSTARIVDPTAPYAAAECWALLN